MEVCMNKRWVEGSYGYWRLPLGGDLVVTVGWEDKSQGDMSPRGYKVTFAGYTATGRPRTIDEARSLGERFAERILELATNKLLAQEAL
jgi:hypothetical protein